MQATQEGRHYQVADVRAVQATLDPADGSCDHRHVQLQTLREQFQGSDDPRRRHMGRVLASFEPGLFVGGDDADLPQDNLDLARWFRHPKGHECRIHGHRHAGFRLVHEGPTLLAALDAPVAHPGQFTEADLQPFWRVPAPACQRQAMHRRTIMRQARSKQNRALLLADLERRYLESSSLCSGSLILIA